MQLPSPAKINLSLRVLGRREDGFHEVRTRLCKLDLCDLVEIEPLNGTTASALTVSDPAIPVDESNLALRALRAFEERTGICRGWRIHLEKHIPSGAGLGGGSSNAAITLQALNQLCGQPLSRPDLLALAATIGSDVPFFLLDSGTADASGRGEAVTPVEFPWRLPVVLIKPPFPIPTPWAYKNWAASKPLNGVLYAPQLCPWGAMVNDLERPVFERHLLLPVLKARLLEQAGTQAALMSGSGSTLFAITRTSVAAEDLAAAAREWCGSTAWVRVTHTIR
jgi:4-diphosphocytidyl-2-C-methyl-D-erythritol kinase